MMRFRAAVSCLSRLAQVEDHELARFAKTRLGDEVPVRPDDLRRVRDILKELGRALARDDGATWSKVRDAHALLVGQGTSAPAVEAPRPAAPVPTALPTHLLAPALPTRAAASPWAPSPIAAAPIAATPIAPPPIAPAPIAPPPIAPAPASSVRIAPAPIAPAVVPAPSPIAAEIEELRASLLSTVVGGQAAETPMPFVAGEAPAAIRSARAASPPPPPPRTSSHARLKATADIPEHLRRMPITPFQGQAQAQAHAQAAAANGPPSSSNGLPTPAGQRFTFAQYASLRAELETRPDRRGEVLGLYGIAGGEEMERIDGIWRRTLAERPELAARFEELRTRYLRYLAASAGSQGAAGR